MESMDFGLSESNFSGANFTQIKSFTPAQVNRDRAQTIKETNKNISAKKVNLENSDDYSDTFE